MKPAKPPSAPVKTVRKFAASPCALAKQVTAITSAGSILAAQANGTVTTFEVLKDGASALYGSDAIAGVVNFILRQDYTGAEVVAGPGV